MSRSSSNEHDQNNPSRRYNTENNLQCLQNQVNISQQMNESRVTVATAKGSKMHQNVRHEIVEEEQDEEQHHYEINRTRGGADGLVNRDGYVDTEAEGEMHLLEDVDSLQNVHSDRLVNDRFEIDRLENERLE